MDKTQTESLLGLLLELRNLRLHKYNKATIVDRYGTEVADLLERMSTEWPESSFRAWQESFMSLVNRDYQNLIKGSSARAVYAILHHDFGHLLAAIPSAGTVEHAGLRLWHFLGHEESKIHEPHQLVAFPCYSGAERSPLFRLPFASPPDPDQERLLSSISSQLQALEETLSAHSSRLAEQEELISKLKREVQDQQWRDSCGVDNSSVPMTRYVPVRIYVSDPVPDQAVLGRIVQAIRDLTDSLGFEPADESPPMHGSWWKSIIIKLHGFFTHEDVQKRIQKAEDALEIAYLDKPQAEANNLQAQAASSLINALKDTNQACIQVGSLLLVKTSDSTGKSVVLSRTLTSTELRHIEENQSLLRQPDKILELLQCGPAKQVDHSALHNGNGKESVRDIEPADAPRLLPDAK